MVSGLASFWGRHRVIGHRKLYVSFTHTHTHTHFFVVWLKRSALVRPSDKAKSSVRYT